MCSKKEESKKDSKCECTVVNIEEIKTNTVKEKEYEANLQCAKGFEEAITATGFGKFNYLLLLCAFPAFSTSVFVSSSLSYIMSSAECDLEMTMADMGKLNIFTYAGMLASALLWGFLSDTLGRRKIMIWGFLALSLCELISSQSQTYFALSMAKFSAGFIFNGPFAILISYISEMHKVSIRAQVLVYIGIYYSIGNVNLPLLAWGIIPQDWTLSLFNGAYVLHSWQIFLSLFSIPPLVTGLSFILLPESPKFLMSRGRNEEALKIFRWIFSMNTGFPENQYPIKELVNERAVNVGDDGSPAPQGWEAIKGGIQQLKPLVLPPHLPHLLLVCFIYSSTMLGSNTLRLWFPQIATIIEDYSSKNTETASLCNIMELYVSNKSYDAVSDAEDVFLDCIKIDSGNETYINSIIIGVASLLPYFAGGYLVNTLGKRKLAAIGLVGSGICSVSLYWSTTFPEIVTFFSIVISVTSLVAQVLATITVDLFPTSIRAMAVAVFMMLGRLGTVLGGITFPHLVAQGCLFPFAFLGSILIGAGFLCFTLPKTTLKKME